MNLAEKKIILLGHKGMLGQMIRAYFEPKVARIITLSTRFDETEKWNFIDQIRQHPGAIVFNAIGKIKQKTDNDNDLLMANAILPAELHNHLLLNQFLVHPSTDCVFSGDTHIPYRHVNESDARDTYGWSKRLGELALTGRRNTLIIRVSIIGEDANPQGKGLLSWFLSNPDGATLKGFTNHKWNGITTLEWCKQVEHFLVNKSKHEKDGQLLQMGTQKSYTKYEILKLFAEVYKRKYTIEPYETPEPIDRRLYPDIVCKPLKEQLVEMRDFCSSNKLKIDF